MKRREPEFSPTSPETLRVVAVSFEQDEARWVESYTQQTATMLRRRALAQTNGHGG